MRSVDDQNIRPLYQALQNLPCIWRFQIQRQSTLVAVVKMPRISVFSHRYAEETVFASLHISPLGGSTLITSAPKSDKITAAPGPAMKLERSTTFSPEKMLSVIIVVFSVTKISHSPRILFPLKICVHAFVGTPVCLRSCLPFQRRSQTTKPQAISLRRRSFPILYSLLRVSTLPRSERS